MSNSRILHISSAKTWRGGENQIYLLLKGHKNQQVENHLLCPYDSALSERIQPDLASVHLFTKRTGFSLFAAFKIKKIVSAEEIDLIHVHDAHAHTFSIIATYLGMCCPIVVTRRVDFKIKKKSLWKYNHKSIVKIIGVSKAIKGVLSHAGVSKNSLQHIYSGIDLSSKMPRKSSTSDSKKTIAFLGAMVEHKDPLTFVKMTNEVITQKDDVMFKMVGHQGNISKQVNEMIEQLGISSYIEILGFRADMTPIWEDIEVLVVSSKEEGLNTTILEAFARRIPVVSTAAGGIVELVTHHKTGLLSPIGDYQDLAKNVLEVLNCKELSKRLTTEAFEYVKAFDHQKIADSYLKLYQEIANI